MPTELHDKTEHTQTRIKGMHCAACSGRIERTVAGLDGVAGVSVNLASETMDIQWDPAAISLEDIAGQVKDLGFEAVLPARETALSLDIKGMHCAACSGRVERTVAGLGGVSKAEVNLASQTGRFVFDPEIVTQRSLREAIHELGFETELQSGGANVFEERRQEALAELKSMKMKLIPAFLFALPLLIISMGHMFGLPLPSWLDPRHSPLNFALVQFLLVLPVMWSGRDFYRRGLPNLWRRTPDMDSLVAVGTGAAFVYSTWNLIAIALGINPAALAMDLYFESTAVLIALISLGKYFEARSRIKTGDSIRALMELRPDRATLIRGEEQIGIPVDEVEVGDLLLIRPGERVPLDGKIVNGTSSVDESMLTGESLPVAKKENDGVIGGTINKNGVLTVRVERVGQDTMLARIIKLVQQAQGSKAPIASLADRISFYFVPTVMSLAIISGLAWYVSGADFPFSLRIFVAVMVIACPCAMGLATPTSIMVGTGRGAQLGVLIKSGEALQTAQAVQAVVFDKTGTLTHGNPSLTDIVTLKNGGVTEDEALTLAASAERVSEHPLAEAVLDAAAQRGLAVVTPDEFEAAPGRGIRAVISGRKILLGNMEMMRDSEVSSLDDDGAAETAESLSSLGRTPLFLAVDGKMAAILAVADQIKDEAAEVIGRLKAMGLKTVMLTGR